MSQEDGRDLKLFPIVQLLFFSSFLKQVPSLFCISVKCRAVGSAIHPVLQLGQRRMQQVHRKEQPVSVQILEHCAMEL